MYVCICHKVNDRTITKAIEEGANNRVALTNALKVGTGCGKCMEHIDMLLNQHMDKKNKADRPQVMPALFIP